MSNLVPEDWGITSLDSNASLITDGSHFSPQTVESGKPIATVQNMRGRHIDVASCRLISADKFEELVKGNCLPEYDDVLFSKDGTIGKTFVYKQKQSIVLLSSIAIIRLKQDQLNPDYCTQYLQSSLFYQQLENAKSGSAIRRVVLKDIKELKLPTPPLPEQQKIAAILTSVDEVIEKTAAQIAKLKDLKTAMMQELLTHGVGVDGKPHTEFKDSPVGRIPKGWEVGGIYDYCHEIFLGLTAKVDYTESEGVFLVRATDISKGVLSFDKARKITLEQHQSLTKKRQAKRGDVLISKSGSLGVCAVVDTDIEFSIYESIIVLQPKEGVIDSKYLLWLMRATETQTRLLGSTVGSTVGHLNLGDFRKLNIPIPTIIEQVKLGDIFDSMNERFTKMENRLQQYRSLKKALMQDLLTGKVRVKVAN